MARKRKLSVDPLLEAEDDETTGQGARTGGFWGGSALNMLKARLEETQRTLADGVMTGTVVLELDPDQIDDEVGSDRLSAWKDDEGFNALVADIARRGQRQAIRVRPRDSGWRPDPVDPLRTDAEFVIQSGRRRLEACRGLKRPVRAVVSTVEGDAALEDLEERFKENTMRADLNGFEELLSIGLIAQGHPDLSQAEISEKLGVPPGDISLGLSCLGLHGVIVLTVDIANTPKRAYRQIVPALRAGKNPAKGQTPSKTPRDDRPEMVTRGRRKAEIRPLKSGFTIRISGFQGSHSEMREAAKAALRYLDGESD